jgi:hypothetical protein
MMRALVIAHLARMKLKVVVELMSVRTALICFAIFALIENELYVQVISRLIVLSVELIRS